MRGPVVEVGGNCWFGHPPAYAYLFAVVGNPALIWMVHHIFKYDPPPGGSQAATAALPGLWSHERKESSTCVMVG